jgi:hypothetical protein
MPFASWAPHALARAAARGRRAPAGPPAGADEARRAGADAHEPGASDGPGLVVGIENVFHSQEEAEELTYVRRVQMIQWTFAARPGHPVPCGMGALVRQRMVNETAARRAARVGGRGSAPLRGAAAGGSGPVAPATANATTPAVAAGAASTGPPLTEAGAPNATVAAAQVALASTAGADATAAAATSSSSAAVGWTPGLGTGATRAEAVSAAVGAGAAPGAETDADMPPLGHDAEILLRTGPGIWSDAVHRWALKNRGRGSLGSCSGQHGSAELTGQRSPPSTAPPYTPRPPHRAPLAATCASTTPHRRRSPMAGWQGTFWWCPSLLLAATSGRAWGRTRGGEGSYGRHVGTREHTRLPLGWAANSRIFLGYLILGGPAGRETGRSPGGQG